jgi:ABC-type histidine transport system ATPase subunit
VREEIPDVYVLLVNHPTTGVKPELLAETLKLRQKLQERSEVRARVRRLEFLKIACSDKAGTLDISRA